MLNFVTYSVTVSCLSIQYSLLLRSISCLDVTGHFKPICKESVHWTLNLSFDRLLIFPSPCPLSSGWLEFTCSKRSEKLIFVGTLRSLNFNWMAERAFTSFCWAFVVFQLLLNIHEDCKVRDWKSPSNCVTCDDRNVLRFFTASNNNKHCATSKLLDNNNHKNHVLN